MMQLQSIITVYIENRNFHSKEARGKPMNYTYILQCADGTFYCGWTNCLEKRLKAHNQEPPAGGSGLLRRICYQTRGYAPGSRHKKADQRTEKAFNCRRNKGSCYKCIHHNIVAQTAAHDKKVENFMGSEIFMPGVKQGQLQSIEHAA